MNDTQSFSPVSSQNSNNPKRTALPVWAAAVIVAAVLLAGAAAGYWYWVKSAQPQSHGQDQPADKTADQNNADDANATTTPATSEATTTAETCKTYTPATRQLSGAIAWSASAPIGAMDIFKTVPGQDASGYIRTNSEFYKVGSVASGSYSGYEVILADIALEGPAFYPNYYRFFRQGGKVVMLGKYSPELNEWDGLDYSKITVDKNYSVSDLDYPKTFRGENNRENFELDQYATFTFCGDGLTKLFHHAILGDVYTSSTQSRKIGTGLAKNEGSYGFYLASPDGTAKVYKLVIDFVGHDNVPKITWADGSKNTTEYIYTDIGGCGSFNYLSVMAPDRVNPAKDLVEVGVNSLGDKIYGLSDSNHVLLKDVYDNQYEVYQGEKISYEQFVKSHPVFFWSDPFGRLVKFQNNKFIPQAECGKPVIYLYPQTATKVSVKLDPQGGFTASEPAYHNGWSVMARPDGQLTEVKSGTVYPYLFWEGRGAVYQQPKKGFVVTINQVEGFLREKLTALGLNEKERADFIEFWLPRMQGAPYYFVTFLGNAAMDAIAPMQVTPKPDTVIRVLMDFSPLEKPIPVEGFKIQTPERTGFTVVEWGGVLRGK